MLLDVFTQRNFVADFFRQKLNFTGKIIAKSRFVPPYGDLGVTYTVHLWLVRKRVVDFLLLVIELFSPALTVEALRADICRDCGVGHFERKFQGHVGSSTNDFWRQKTRVPVCLRDPIRFAVLIQYRRVTHRQTHTHRHAH